MLHHCNFLNYPIMIICLIYLTIYYNNKIKNNYNMIGKINNLN